MKKSVTFVVNVQVDGDVTDRLLKDMGSTLKRAAELRLSGTRFIRGRQSLLVGKKVRSALADVR